MSMCTTWRGCLRLRSRDTRTRNSSRDLRTRVTVWVRLSSVVSCAAGRLGRTVTTVSLTIIYFYPRPDEPNRTRVPATSARSCRAVPAATHRVVGRRQRNGPQQLSVPARLSDRTALYDNDRQIHLCCPITVPHDAHYEIQEELSHAFAMAAAQRKTAFERNASGVRSARALPRGYSPSPKRAARPLPHVVGGKPFIMLCV